MLWNMYSLGEAGPIDSGERHTSVVDLPFTCDDNSIGLLPEKFCEISQVSEVTNKLRVLNLFEEYA